MKTIRKKLFILSYLGSLLLIVATVVPITKFNNQSFAFIDQFFYLSFAIIILSAITLVLVTIKKYKLSLIPTILNIVIIGYGVYDILTIEGLTSTPNFAYGIALILYPIGMIFSIIGGLFTIRKDVEQKEIKTVTYDEKMDNNFEVSEPPSIIEDTDISLNYEEQIPLANILNKNKFNDEQDNLNENDLIEDTDIDDDTEDIMNWDIDIENKDENVITENINIKNNDENIITEGINIENNDENIITEDMNIEINNENITSQDNDIEDNTDNNIIDDNIENSWDYENLDNTNVTQNMEEKDSEPDVTLESIEDDDSSIKDSDENINNGEISILDENDELLEEIEEYEYKDDDDFFEEITEDIPTNADNNIIDDNIINSDSQEEIFMNDISEIQNLEPVKEENQLIDNEIPDLSLNDENIMTNNIQVEDKPKPEFMALNPSDIKIDEKKALFKKKEKKEEDPLKRLMKRNIPMTLGRTCQFCNTPLGDDERICPICGRIN